MHFCLILSKAINAPSVMEFPGLTQYNPLPRQSSIGEFAFGLYEK